MERRQFLTRSAAVTTGLTVVPASGVSAWPSDRYFEYSIGSFFVERTNTPDEATFDVEWLDENRAHITGTVIGATGCSRIALAGVERVRRSLVVQLDEVDDVKVNELCTLATIGLEFSLTIHFSWDDRYSSLTDRLRRQNLAVEYTSHLDDPLEDRDVMLRSFTWSPTTASETGPDVEIHDDYREADRATVDGVVVGHDRRTELLLEDLSYDALEKADDDEPEVELHSGGNSRVTLRTASPVDPYAVPGTNLEYGLELIYPNGAPAAVGVDVLAE